MGVGRIFFGGVGNRGEISFCHPQTKKKFSTKTFIEKYLNPGGKGTPSDTRANDCGQGQFLQHGSFAAALRLSLQ